MKSLLRKTIFWSLVIGIIITAIAFFVFYIPLGLELEKRALDAFEILSQNKVQHIHHFTQKGIDGAKSISSRTEIRNRIVEYKEGSISMDYLKDYTEPRYEEGLSALTNVLGAVRIVNEEIIAKQGEIDNSLIQEGMHINELFSRIYMENDSTEMIVYSPIIHNEVILGMDIIYFDISEYIEMIVNSRFKLEVLQKEDIGNKSLKQEEGEIVITGTKIGYLYRMDQYDNYFFISTNEEILYGPGRQLAYNSFIVFILSLLLVIGLVNLAFIKNAGKIILIFEKSKDTYKEMAYKDSLTEAYSREFLKHWIETVYKQRDLEKTPYIISLIDVNDFKHVNDTYGHIEGDKVLYTISKVLKESIRDNDLVIRYGGDEFLLILNLDSMEEAEGIMARIVEKLRNINNYNICISYGMCKASREDEFLDAIDKADKTMYYNKAKKQIEDEIYV